MPSILSKKSIKQSTPLDDITGLVLSSFPSAKANRPYAQFRLKKLIRQEDFYI